jgi:hypothetical protein
MLANGALHVVWISRSISLAIHAHRTVGRS